jgi:hypothetical protein
MSCRVVASLNEAHLAEVEDAESCIVQPEEDDELENKLFTRAIDRALGGPYAGAMVTALVAGRLRKHLTRGKGESWEAAGHRYLAALVKSENAFEEKPLVREPVSKATQPVSTFEPSWQGQFLVDAMRLAEERRFSRGQLAMIGMLATQAVTESTSEEEADRRFALKLEAVGEKAQADRRAERERESVRMRHTLGAQAHHRGEVEEIRLGPNFNPLNEPDPELERDLGKAAYDRAEHEREQREIEAARARWERSVKHPSVLDRPQQVGQ